MLDWIARNWRDQWLGNFVWWQSFAAVLQCASAILILWLTRRYVKLTNSLVRAGIDPVVELVVPSSAQGYTTAFALRIKNIGTDDVVNLAAACRLYARTQAAPFTHLAGPNSFKVQDFGTIAKGHGAEFLFHECVDAADASRRDRTQKAPGSPMAYRLVFWVTYQRPYDHRIYERTMRLDVRWNSSDEVFVLRSELLEEPLYSD